MDSGSSPSLFCSRPHCRNPAASERKMCAHHLEACRKYIKTARSRSKEPGTCSVGICKNLTDGTHRMCAQCIAKTSAYNARPAAKGKRGMWSRATRAGVLGHYGGKCACCAVADYDILTIDHCDGFAGVGPRGGHQLTSWLKRNNYPEGFRVLCFTCNFVLGHHGYCVHSELTQRHLMRRGTGPKAAKEAERKKRYNRELKRQALLRYGELRCGDCPEDHLECLTLDHINQDGATHRRADKNAHSLYAWLRRRGYPPGYRILCFNCNWKRYLASARELEPAASSV